MSECAGKGLSGGPVPAGSRARRTRHGSPAAIAQETIEVRTTAQLRDLETDLFGDRDVAVVVIAQAEEGELPALNPEDVRRVVGPNARIYVVLSTSLLGRLTRVLGAGLSVYCGEVRVLWPGLSSRDDPADHPLVKALPGEPQKDTLRELELQFDLSRPHVRREIKQLDELRAMAEIELNDAKRRLAAIERDRHPTERVRDTAKASADNGDQSVGLVDLQTHAVEKHLQFLISREWRALPQASRIYRLGDYLLASDLLTKLAGRTERELEPVARVIALVASRCAPTGSDPIPRPMLTVPGGEQHTRSDGAEGWLCPLVRNHPRGAQLEYWMRPDGVIEVTDIHRIQRPVR
jgi:hypothetical protein